jgi:hypothetical protein
MKTAWILTLACLAATEPQILFGQDTQQELHPIKIVLHKVSDGTTFTLSSSPVRADGSLCVPLADLARALHGTPALSPSLALEGSTLRVVGPPAAEADEYWPINRMQTDQGVGTGPAPAHLGVRRAGVVSSRIRIVEVSRGERLTCVLAADLARALGGTLNEDASIDVFDQQIENMMNNNILFLAIQTKVQNVSQTTQLMSNIFKTDSDAKLDSVRTILTTLSEETETALEMVSPEQAAWARSFASRRGYRAGKAEIEAAIGAAFPHASQEEKIKIHMILLQIMMGDIVGALRSYAILRDQNMRGFSREVLDRLDEVQEARTTIIRSFARTKPPRAYAGQDPAAAARAQERSARYTQFVQMSTQLMNELQNTERELVDALQTMNRDLESFWESYSGFRDQESRTNERIIRP